MNIKNLYNMSKRFVIISSLATLFGVILACTPEPRPVFPPSSGNSSELAEHEGLSLRLDSLDVVMYEFFPVEAEAVMRGYVSDSCVKLGYTLPDQQGNTFTMRLTPKPNERFACTGKVKPFELKISLPVDGLPAGQYELKVNQLAAQFDLMVDNIIRY